MSKNVFTQIRTVSQLRCLLKLNTKQCFTGRRFELVISTNLFYSINHLWLFVRIFSLVDISIYGVIIKKVYSFEPPENTLEEIVREVMESLNGNTLRWVCITVDSSWQKCL